MQRRKSESMSDVRRRASANVFGLPDDEDAAAREVTTALSAFLSESVDIRLTVA